MRKPKQKRNIIGRLLLVTLLIKTMLPAMAFAHPGTVDPDNPAATNIVICTSAGLRIVSFNPESGEYDEQNIPNSMADDCQFCLLMHQVAIEPLSGVPFHFSIDNTSGTLPVGTLYMSTAPPIEDSAPRAPPISHI